MPRHAERLEFVAHHFTALWRQQAAQRQRGDINDVGVMATHGKIVGEFAADQTRTDDHHAFLPVEQRMKAPVVVEIVDGDDGVGCIPGNRQTNLIRTQCQHQLGIDERFIADVDGMRGSVNRRDTRFRTHRGVQLRGHLLG